MIRIRSLSVRSALFSYLLCKHLRGVDSSPRVKGGGGGTISISAGHFINCRNMQVFDVSYPRRCGKDSLPKLS